MRLPNAKTTPTMNSSAEVPEKIPVRVHAFQPPASFARFPMYRIINGRMEVLAAIRFPDPTRTLVSLTLAASNFEKDHIPAIDSGNGNMSKTLPDSGHSSKVQTEDESKKLDESEKLDKGELQKLRTKDSQIPLVLKTHWIKSKLLRLRISPNSESKFSIHPLYIST